MAAGFTSTVTTRHARPEDEEYLYNLYCNVRRDEFASVPVTDAERTAMLRMQYEWQTAAYRSAFPGTGYQIVEVDAQPTGRIWVSRSAGLYQLVDIAIDPAFQKRGIATAMLRGLQSEALADNAVIRSSVFRFNGPSIRLHQRLGFRIASESDMELNWIWQPAV